MTEDHAAMRNDLVSATGSSSRSSSSAAASAEMGATSASTSESAGSRFFSSSTEPPSEGARGEAGALAGAGALIARVGSKSKSSGHCRSDRLSDKTETIGMHGGRTMSEVTTETIAPTPIDARLPASISRSPPVVYKWS